MALLSLGTDACTKAFWKMTMYLCHKDSNFVPHTIQEREALSQLFLELFWICQLYVGILFSDIQVTIIAFSQSFKVNPFLSFPLDFQLLRGKMLSLIRFLYSQPFTHFPEVLIKNNQIISLPIQSIFIFSSSGKHPRGLTWNKDYDCCLSDSPVAFPSSPASCFMPHQDPITCVFSLNTCCFSSVYICQGGPVWHASGMSSSRSPLTLPGLIKPGDILSPSSLSSLDLDHSTCCSVV